MFFKFPDTMRAELKKTQVILRNTCARGRFLSSIIFSMLAACSPTAHISHPYTQEDDTCINISKNYYFVLHQKMENGSIIFSNPRLCKKNKTIPLQLYFNSTSIDDMTFVISPHEKFLVMCYIADNGYVYVTEKDSIYHEVSKCSMIALKNGSIIKGTLTPIESGGEWGENDKWIDQSGKILIDPKGKRE